MDEAIVVLSQQEPIALLEAPNLSGTTNGYDRTSAVGRRLRSSGGRWRCPLVALILSKDLSFRAKDLFVGAKHPATEGRVSVRALVMLR